MRASLTKNGVTLRIIAGTTNTILGMDLQPDKRKGCLGFSIHRLDLGPVGKPLEPDKRQERWLPNLLQFPGDKTDPTKTTITTLTAPLQKFRWGDYTCDPGHTYRYQVVPRYGTPLALLPAKITDTDGVTVEVSTEDNSEAQTAVFFNRGAAASHAFDVRFPKIKTESQLLADTPQATEAKDWLSRGLEEAILAFLGKATNDKFAIHAAIYEFQKPRLLQGLLEARQRGVDVQVVYHHRCKGDKDTTAEKNDEAIKAAQLPADMVTPRKANPQDAIMHNKFIVLLKRQRDKMVPFAVWTGSVNWTDGAIYGQLNVGHAVYQPDIAATYEQYFQLLKSDAAAEDMKDELGKLTPVSLLIPARHGITAILSPQDTDTMLHLYSSICGSARCVLVCAPFALSPIILAAFTTKPPAGSLRFFLLDKEASLGKGQEVSVIENDPSNMISVAATQPSALHNFQGKLLLGKESFRHAGIHIHSKIILADPFGSDPILVMGSANFSRNSTEINDSNSLVFRGDTAIADIYTTEFMRMFEHYHFRASEAHALKKKKAQPKAPGDKSAKNGDAVIALHPDDSWSDDYYAKDSNKELDRRMFAGTLI
jgi:phosphatidylserine/phosphatidylglycerophosphate/cardiolipin synthase-like enzyme